MKTAPRNLELLAPARDLTVGREAILHGADAVYIGADAFGARSRAGNSVADIAELVKFAAPFGVKVYVTVNTLVFDNELAAVERLIRDLYRAGVDALIVQDLGILRLDLPPIALHASTQCDTRDPAKARFLQQCGFSQIVIARESSLEQTAAICRSVDVPVEAFVHGALCVSYSGDCQASRVTTGRSANRGCCAQMCRLPYDLVDGDGKVVATGRHFLSLKDMNRLSSLREMADAGVASFKIEGRLKDAAYVKNVVAAYSQALDAIIAANPGLYRRSSRGVSTVDFIPSLDKCFNRRYTDYFLHGVDNQAMAVFDTPKSIGLPVGTVTAVRRMDIEASLTEELVNGDGLSFITPSGEVGGFRVNRIDHSTIMLQEPVAVTVGSKLYRSYDKRWEERMNRPTARRQIPIALTLRAVGDDRLVLEADVDEIGKVAVAADADLQPAMKPDNGYRARALSKTGDTIFAVISVDDRLGDRFVPASVLAPLRRQLIERVTDTLLAANHSQQSPRPTETPLLPDGYAVSRHDNVANHLAAQFMAEAAQTDAKSIPRSIDLPSADVKAPDLTVMTTRYCLRREIGACLKARGAAAIKGPLFLRGSGFHYRLDFDCSACQADCRMRVIANPSDAPKR